MKKSYQPIRKLHGKALYNGFLAGAGKIFEHQQYINSINVFPVRDADTGTNLASTFHSIVHHCIPSNNAKETAVSIADAAILGARGNSGIIFAQFLYGFGNELKGHSGMNVHQFSTAIKESVRYAYESITNPMEGTMISVIREWSEAMEDIREKTDDFVRLLMEAHQKAMDALKATTDKLDVLKKAKVVDAGAKGFVLFLEGMLEYMKTGIVPETHAPVVIEEEFVVEDDHSQFTYRYCTEVLLENSQLPLAKVKAQLKPMGDSLVVAGSEKKMRIHIHADEPDKVCTMLSQNGKLVYQKVDDMLLQKEVATRPLSKTAILTDSTCDLPDEILDKHQIHMVPLTVHFGEKFFIDRMTIQPETFMEMLETVSVHPSTAQPTRKEFINKYNYLDTHYDNILALHLTSNMSGTWSGSVKAVEALSPEQQKKIYVRDTKRLSTGLGMLVLRTARAAEAGMPYDELVKKQEEWSKKTHLLVSSKTLKYMVKSGRVSAMKGRIGSLLNLKPMVKINDRGVSELVGKPFTEKQSRRLVLNEMQKIAGQNKIWGYAISHFQNMETAQWYAEQMEQLTGRKPEFISSGSPVIGAGVGPGTVALSVMVE